MPRMESRLEEVKERVNREATEGQRKDSTFKNVGNETPKRKPARVSGWRECVFRDRQSQSSLERGKTKRTRSRRRSSLSNQGPDPVRLTAGSTSMLSVSLS